MVHEDELSFTLEEFGLTEADLSAYEAEQQRQQLAFNPYKQRPLSIDLQRRLDHFRHTKTSDSPSTQQEHDQLLKEVDTLIADERQEWEKAFQGMAMAGDDHLLDPEPMILTEWETREWEWEPGLAEQVIK